MKKIILDLCGGTGSWSKPYKDAGYDVRVVTLPDNDVRSFKPPENVHGILAAPPCTNFSFVLNEKIERDFNAAMEIVDACARVIAESSPKWWALENPVGHLQRFIGKPLFIFQPWEFGDPWTKRTAIWGKFTPPIPSHMAWRTVEKNMNLYIRPGRKKPNMVWLHKSAKSHIPGMSTFIVKTDADFRSITPPGFSRAFFEANP